MRNSSKAVIRTAVFPVAGRGTRFLPATKASPKEMLPVVDKDGTRTYRQIILYAAALVAISLLPSLVGLAGVLYFFGALVSCMALVQVCLWAAHSKTNARAKWLMHATVLHIPLLLGLMAYDKVPR